MPKSRKAAKRKTSNKESAGCVTQPVCVSDYARDEFVKSPQVAALIKCSEQWLRMSRVDPPAWQGPPYHKISNGGILYKWGEVIEWIEAQRVNPAERATA